MCEKHQTDQTFDDFGTWSIKTDQSGYEALTYTEIGTRPTSTGRSIECLGCGAPHVELECPYCGRHA